MHEAGNGWQTRRCSSRGKQNAMGRWNSSFWENKMASAIIKVENVKKGLHVSANSLRINLGTKGYERSEEMKLDLIPE